MSISHKLILLATMWLIESMELPPASCKFTKFRWIGKQTKRMEGSNKASGSWNRSWPSSKLNPFGNSYPTIGNVSAWLKRNWLIMLEWNTRKIWIIKRTWKQILKSPYTFDRFQTRVLEVPRYCVWIIEVNERKLQIAWTSFRVLEYLH